MNNIKIGLITILVGAFLYYYYTYNPAGGEGVFLACPIKSVFGVDCPSCGSQRMIHHLLHFEFRDAFRSNPLLFVLMPLVLVLVYQFISNLVFGTSYRIKLFYKNWFVFALFAVVILYGILRNLPYYPFNLLAPVK